MSNKNERLAGRIKYSLICNHLISNFPEIILHFLTGDAVNVELATFVFLFFLSEFKLSTFIKIHANGHKDPKIPKKTLYKEKTKKMYFLSYSTAEGVFSE